MVRWLRLCLVLCTGACLEPELPGPLIGSWGGDHLGLVASASGVTLEFDCATGSIPTALVPDAAGEFSVAGFHSPGHGGPVHEEEVPVQIPARFDGVIRGDLLTISVTLTTWATTLGPYTLIRGAIPRVFKCL